MNPSTIPVISADDAAIAAGGPLPFARWPQTPSVALGLTGAHVMDGEALDSIWLGGGGRSLPATGLAAEWMRLAGLRQRQLRGDRVTLGQLLVSPPQVLLRSDYRAGEYSGEQRWLNHPLAQRTRAGKTLATDGRRWTCMGPSLVPEMARLRRELAR